MGFNLSFFYFWRTLHQGKLYVIFSIFFLPIVSLAYYLSNTTNADSSAILTIYPFVIPILSFMCSVPLMSFFRSDDRSGFYEYLFATTDINVRKLYQSLFIGAILVVAIPITILSILMMSLSFFTDSIFVLSGTYAIFLVYTIPVSFSIPPLMLAIATTWSITTVPIRGPMTTSPAGGVGMIGVAMVVIPMLIYNDLGVFEGMRFIGIYSFSVFLVFLIIYAISVKRLTPERFLP